MKYLTLTHLTSTVIVIAAYLLAGCTNGTRTYKVTAVNYSKGMDTLFAGKPAAFKKALQHTTLEITIQDDTLMIVKGLPETPSLQLHRLKARKNSDMPKHTYRTSDKDGNALDISLSGTGFKDMTLRTRALYLFKGNISTDKLTLSPSDTRRWLATVEIKGEKE